MNDMFNTNTNPEIFSLTAIIVGLIIEADYTADELNSIGNWLILVGQVTLTTAAQQQLINNRYQRNSGGRIKSDANSPGAKNTPLATHKDLANLHQRIDELERRFFDQ